MGEERKSGKGGRVKGPAILPAVISFCNLDMTNSGFWRGTFQIRRLETGTVADKLYAKAVTKSVDQICS